MFRLTDKYIIGKLLVNYNITSRETFKGPSFVPNKVLMMKVAATGFVCVFVVGIYSLICVAVRHV